MKQELRRFLINLLISSKKQQQTNKEEKKKAKTKQIYLINLTWKEKKKKHTGEAFAI